MVLTTTLTTVNPLWGPFFFLEIRKKRHTRIWKSFKRKRGGEGMKAGLRPRQWRHYYPTATGVASLPRQSPSPSRRGGYGSRATAQSHSISCTSPLAHSLPSSSTSIHPDYTSNGTSSQQPPTVMELCLNEQSCLSASPLFSLSASPPPPRLSLSLIAHSSHLPIFIYRKNSALWRPVCGEEK